MRILHLISSSGLYGAEAVILGLSKQLLHGGDTSTIGVFSNAGHQLHERALADGIPVLRIACAHQLDRETLASIRSAARESNADVVHAHGYKADLYALAALRGQGIPLISTCHTWYDNDLAVRFYGALDRRALRWFHCVVAVSAEVEKRLLASGVPAAHIRRIRNGVTMPTLPKRDQRGEPFNVGLVGRLAPEKGIDIFLRAASIVARHVPGTRFIVFGDGPDRLQLEAMVRALGLEQVVSLPGRSEAMSEAYAGLDLLVSASRQEGLPMALLEGMATGLPVVATAVGEVPTLVRDGVDGLLVAPEHPEALAAAILALLHDREKLVRFGANARFRVAQDFSVERMAAEYRAVYCNAIEGAAH